LVGLCVQYKWNALWVEWELRIVGVLWFLFCFYLAYFCMLCLFCRRSFIIAVYI